MDSEVRYEILNRFPAYRVGTDGSLWTRWSRRIIGYRKGTETFIGTEWRLMKPYIGKNGRPRVKLSDGEKLHRLFVHTLVLEAFVGPCPPGMEACHFPDRNPANCSLDNLRWDTRKNNHADKIIHGTDNRGEKHNAATITDADVPEIRKAVDGGMPQVIAAKKWKTTKYVINGIISGRTWSHV